MKKTAICMDKLSIKAVENVTEITERDSLLSELLNVSIYENMNDCSYNDKPLSLDTFFELSEFFKFFGDTTRIRIIEILLSGEISVNEIAEKLQLGQSAVSHQLRILRTAGLVKPRRVGRTVFYALDDEHIGLIFNTGLAHIMRKKGV